MEMTGDYDDWEIVDTWYEEDVPETHVDYHNEYWEERELPDYERERQEDAMDAAQAMEEAELRDEYYRGLDVE